MFNTMTAPEDICIPSRGEQLAAYHDPKVKADQVDFLRRVVTGVAA